MTTGRYLLVVGCLGDANSEYTVRWNWKKSDHLRVPNLRPIAEFRGTRVLESAHVENVLQVGPTEVASASSQIEQHRRFDSEPIHGRDIFVHVTDGDLNDPKQYVRVKTGVVACGPRVQILLDRQIAPSGLPVSSLDEVLSILETEVLPTVEARIGTIRDVDNDGRFTVVLTPWLSRLQGGQTSINGMVRSSDFHNDIPQPLGGNGDLLLLNSELPKGSALRDLLFHEVSHAACISQRLSPKFGRFLDEHDWLSEALAHLSEPGWSNLEERLTVFLDSPSQFPLVVPDYFRAGLWRNSGCRGATYLFARWCVDQHGSDLPRRLAASSLQGVQNLEQATLRRFEDLFRSWTLAAANNSIPSFNLHQTLDRRDIAGVRRITSRFADEEQFHSLRGTSFAVIELLTHDVNCTTLSLVGDPAAAWQFSICRIAEDSSSHSKIR